MQEDKSIVKEALRRDLGLLDAVGIGLGAVMGAGIFVEPCSLYFILLFRECHLLK